MGLHGRVGLSGFDRVGGLGTIACKLLLDPMDRYGLLYWTARIT